MIVHHREPGDGDCEDLCKFLQPKLDRFSAVDRAFAQQESATLAAGDAMILTGYGRIDEVARGMVTGGVFWFVGGVYPNC